MQSHSASVSMLAPRILIPFLLVSLIWGSTWLVIKDQIGSVPPVWSVSYRFLVAALGMFVLVWFRKLPLSLGRQGQVWALAIGLCQFTLNFNFVYNAERFVTSGLVAVMFALLMVPNAILGRLWLGQRISGGFIAGSGIAACGIALLFVHEYRTSATSLSDVVLGAALTCGGIMAASVSNVMQGTERIKGYPIIVMLAWAMLWGGLINMVAAWVIAGPPMIEWRPGYVGGILYLGIIGSVVTFPLYFNLIREIGPGKAAYSGFLVPVVAMILSTVFEGYRWAMLPAAGAVLALVGLLVALWSRSPRTPRIGG
jgi:drug/metabolite transporter (DMT)-like permease